MVRYKDRFALRITDRTPNEVLIENLLFLWYPSRVVAGHVTTVVVPES